MAVKKILTVLKWVCIGLLTIIVLFGLLVAYWYLRPNRSVVDGDVVTDVYPIAADEFHNSNTDMIYWSDAFYLIHARAPFHFASDTTVLVLLRSEDARTWEEIATFQNPGEDIRDPKLAVINDRLFMYCLKNRDFSAEPYTTAVTSSVDGVAWEPLVDIEHEGWLFWRPKTPDGGKTWYCPAYWHEHGKSALFKSTDGVTWEFVSQIYEGDVNDETAIVFLPDGRILATARLEVGGYLFGDNDGNTLISVSEPPYVEWTENHSTVTRFDGPLLFYRHGFVLGVGRFHTGPKLILNNTGSILGKKRTSLFLVREDHMVRLTDLPSTGDTSYPGLVIRGDTAYVCYYTSSVNRDYPWILGMLSPSDIMMAVIDLEAAERLAESKMELAD
ncbi:MAG: exo-alpha-sialidase [Deltaproteobacteria bacterium]|nr:exo-alpha-sialidase [Candidatus Zymogenaceae bacterium]